MKEHLWDLYEGIEVVRQIQSRLRPLGFHVALAGGNLNVGYSDKDLDLVFLPLVNDKAPLVEHVLMFLQENGWKETPWGTSHEPKPFTPYRYQGAWVLDGRRIDIFIV